MVFRKFFDSSSQSANGFLMAAERPIRAAKAEEGSLPFIRRQPVSPQCADVKLDRVGLLAELVVRPRGLVSNSLIIGKIFGQHEERGARRLVLAGFTKLDGRRDSL